MWIIKLGGSLLDYSGLPLWLDAIANSRQSVVIVVGGGQLADAVRNAQKRWRFTDAVAHHMALLTIEQNVRFLARLDSRLVPCADTQAIEKNFGAGKVPIWLPEKMVMSAEDIIPDWATTSDSLSAWLANQLPARGLLLVKSCFIPGGNAEASLLCRSEIVDQAFPSMIEWENYPVWIMQRDKYNQFDKLLLGQDADALQVRAA